MKDIYKLLEEDLQLALSKMLNQLSFLVFNFEYESEEKSKYINSILAKDCE